jgi:hypothetical protein
MESYDESTREAAGQFGGLSPRVLWVIGIAIACFLVWAGMQVARSISTSRQIEQVERVVSRRGAMQAAQPLAPVPRSGPANAAAPPAAAPAVPKPPAQLAAAPGPERPARTPPKSAAAAPESPAVPPLAVALASGPPPSTAAVPPAQPESYDSSGWSGEDADLTAESSGSSDSSSDIESQPERRRVTPRPERREPAAVASELYGSNLFSRCPRPGVPGAVECRRAVCAGAARRAPSCKYYQDGQMD